MAEVVLLPLERSEEEEQKGQQTMVAAEVAEVREVVAMGGRETLRVQMPTMSEGLHLLLPGVAKEARTEQFEARRQMGG